MACTPTPTQTLYEVLTTTSVSTSFTDITSTIPPDISTLLSTFCASSTVDANDTDSATICLSTGSVEVVTTLRDEEVTTIPSQVVFSVPVILSEPTSTLFSTCPPDSGISHPPPPPPPPSSSSSTSQTSQTSQALSSQLSASVIVSQVSSTLPGGSVVVTLVTSTSTMPPAVSTASTTGGGGSGSNNNNADRDNIREVLGPAIGGAVGGFVGLIALAMLIWFIWRKRDSIRAMYAKEQTPKIEPAFYERWGHHDRAASPPLDAEPKPYQYGLVGRRPGSASRTSSPSTSPPPTRPQSLAFTGVSHSPGPYSTGYPYNPPTPNSASGLAPSPSPYSPYFPQQPPSPAANGLLAPSAPPHPPVWSGPTTSAAVTPSPHTPQSPEAQPSPAFHRQSDSMTSVGTAVSYPFPVLPPERREERDERRHSEDESSVSERAQRPFRLSLTLANWNPETDGELFPRASTDDGRPEHENAGHEESGLR